DVAWPALLDERLLDAVAFRDLLVHQPRAAHASAARPRREQLRRLLRVPHREGELRRALVLGGRDRRVGTTRLPPLDRVPPLRLRPAHRGAPARTPTRPERRRGRITRQAV